MKRQELLQQTDDLRQTMEKAAKIAERLHESFNEHQQPAILAQCNVIRAFLAESVAHERLVSEMIKTKIKD
jgi:hypothetical protein